MADLSITAASVGVGGPATKTRIVQAGEAVAQGEPCYLHADGKYYKADANDTEAKAVAAGVFLVPAALDGYAIIAVSGPVNLGATLTVGEVYVVSATLGGIAPIGDLASGHYVTTLGVASSASVLELAPSASGIVKP